MIQGSCISTSCFSFASCCVKVFFHFRCEIHLLSGLRKDNDIARLKTQKEELQAQLDEASGIFWKMP